jgi:hypothetical protein
MKKTAGARIALRLKHDELALLDKKVTRMRTAQPWARITRSEAVRAAILAFVEEK